ncbi:hypothetical protein [Halocatena marina]|uniref:DUF7847 domain-containing protein n=1 Tax=Halocatena marina TaxID=2934937 RepID=A0ABD5YM34_9EURY|nr:hypothetical protein [Halocatena marina]
MSLDIGDALRKGLDRSTERNGAILFALLFVLQAVSTVASQSALSRLLPRLIQRMQEAAPEPIPPEVTQAMERTPPLAVPIPVEAAVALILVIMIFEQAVLVISDRTFISDATERLHEPKRWLGWATVSSIGAVIFIYALTFLLFVPAWIVSFVSLPLAILLGLIAAVIGLFLGLSFFFFRQEIAAEDIGPVEALTDSWSLVKGDRFEVFGLIILLSFITFVVNFISGLLFGLFGRVPEAVGTIVITSALFVFSSAVAAQAYRQLRAAKRNEGSTEADDSTDDLDPNNEWNDPPL